MWNNCDQERKGNLEYKDVQKLNSLIFFKFPRLGSKGQYLRTQFSINFPEKFSSLKMFLHAFNILAYRRFPIGYRSSQQFKRNLYDTNLKTIIHKTN